MRKTILTLAVLTSVAMGSDRCGMTLDNAADAVEKATLYFDVKKYDDAYIQFDSAIHWQVESIVACDYLKDELTADMPKMIEWRDTAMAAYENQQELKYLRMQRKALENLDI